MDKDKTSCVILEFETREDFRSFDRTCHIYHLLFDIQSIYAFMFVVFQVNHNLKKKTLDEYDVFVVTIIINYV